MSKLRSKQSQVEDLAMALQILPLPRLRLGLGLFSPEGNLPGESPKNSGFGEFEIVNDFILAVNELKAERTVARLDQHGAVILVVAQLAS